MSDPEFAILSERTRFGNETSAGAMVNRCAFTSRDMGADWPEAFTYAIVFGWHDNDPECDAEAEIAERFGWDAEMLSFLRDAHERFSALAPKADRQKEES